MKKAKKLLVTLLVLTFVLSIMSTGFAQDTTTSTTTSSSSQAPEVVRAQALGILKGDEKGNLNLDQPITRAEALALIIRISGLEASADLMKGQTKFTDVNSDAGLQWATGYINLGVGQGIINGYPDGTFKGRNTVTYAEMAKLLLYAMNYGVTVEGTVWPAGVMGKADDLDIFDGVSASPNVPATRGAVVKMIDNSLTVKHLKQTGYGDLKSYEEGTDTFLSKMGVDEIDCRITATDIKDGEVTVEPIDDEQPIDSTETYTVLDKTTDVESLLGVEATIWVNDDDEIFFIDPNMDDVKIDVVSDVDADNNEIELKIADDTYDVASNVQVYINGEKVTGDARLEALEAGMYGSFVFDDDEIIYINVKDWNEVEAGVVEKVDDNIITYYDENGDETDLDLEDPNDGYVISLDGKDIQPDDIEANDVIYVADYDDMYHILVVRDTVSGELEKVKSDEVQIAGESYDVATDESGTIIATLSPNENDDIYAYGEDYNSDDSVLDDMLGEDTTAILDIAGDVRHLVSSVETTSDDFYGVLLKVDDYNDTVKVDVKGETTSYDIDADIHNETGANIDVDNDGIDDDDVLAANDFALSELKSVVNDSADKYAVVKFTLDSDGEIDEMWVYSVVNLGTDPYTITGNEATIDYFDEDDDVIATTGSDDYFVDDNTIIIDEIDDIDLVNWDNIKDKTFASGSVKAIIVPDDKDAKLVIFTDGFDNIEEEDESLGVVLDRFKDADGDWAVTVSTYNGQEADYKVDSKDAQKVGDAIAYTLDADNELTVSQNVYGPNKDVKPNTDFTVAGGVVLDKSSSTITIDINGDGDEDANEEFKVSSKTLVFDNTDGFDDIDTAAYRDVHEGDTVTVIVENSLVKLIYINDQD